MKLLRIEANGIYLFNKNVVIDFFAEQRISHKNDECLYNVFNNIYINNAISFVGINASGKTLSLKLVTFVIKMLNAEPINNIEIRSIFDRSINVKLNIYFYDDKYGICLLKTIIKPISTNNKARKYIIDSERLYTRKINSNISKNKILSFREKDLFKTRDTNEEQQLFLKDDVSIIISLGKDNKIPLYETLEQTDDNFINVIGSFPSELVQFLDPSIEYFRIDSKNSEIALKFYKDSDKIMLHDFNSIKNYLSSGTIKGLYVFMDAWATLMEGGYLIIDEIENHFNKEIVASLIRFFMDESLNHRGAVIVYSTHYAELLDILERSDCIYVLNNKNGIELRKFNYIFKRNDIKKSVAYESDSLVGTAPSYESYIKLKKVLASGEIKEK